MSGHIDWATLEKALERWDVAVTDPSLSAIIIAARAHLETLPKTKVVEVRLVARLSLDGSKVYYCQRDTPEHRQECGSFVIRCGGQLVTLSGLAEVPA